MGAENWATIASLIETCKLNAVEPQAYLTATLTAIVNGQGKARVGDSLWLAEGPDLPAGAPVEVVGVDGSTLKVKAA